MRGPRSPGATHSLQFSRTIFIFHIKYKYKYASLGYYHFHTSELIMQRLEKYFESETSGNILKGTILTTSQLQYLFI